MASNVTQVELTALLPMPFRLGYGIPLVVMSTALALTGAFLTLDRTRTFPPLSVGANGGKVIYRLEGGVGGLIAGWAFGVHLSTFLALIITNLSTAAPLTIIEFLVIWALVGIVTSLLAGRLRLVALVFMSITGGVALALALAILIHPPLLPRQIFVAVFTPVLVVASLVPVPVIHLNAIRLSAALSGAFGAMVGSAVLGDIGAWANVWDRLWLEDSLEWGTGAEHGLSAGFWVLTAVGFASNWFLRRQFGENPDQRWDSYLAKYAASLPNRAGNFKPHETWFSKFIHSSPSDPVVFPSDEELQAPPFSSPLAKGRLRNKKPRTPGTRGIKFQPLKDLSSDSDSDSDLDSKPPRGRPLPSSSGTSVTAVSDRAKGKRKADDVDYSDAETTLPTLSKTQSPNSDAWKPAFLARAQSASPAPPGAVPVTPSLINAIDRIQRAQSAAYRSGPTSPLASPSAGGEDSDKEDASRPNRWRAFWADVQTKATEPDPSPLKSDKS